MNHLAFGLTDQQIQCFWADGFLALPNIMPSSEVESLRQDYNSITNLIYSDEQIAEFASSQKLPFDHGQSFFLWIPLPGMLHPNIQDSQSLDDAVNIVQHCLTVHATAQSDEAYKTQAIQLIRNLLRMNENIKRTVYFRNVLQIASQLLQVQEHQIIAEGRIFYKPALHGSTIPWHQDGAHAECADKIKIWVPLDPVDEHNGCMEFIKQSHHHLLKFQTYPGDASGSFMKTDDDQIDFSQHVTCPLPAGGATIHHRLTLHATGANQSNIPRRVLTIVCKLVN
jgi:hypothetical protein